MNPESKMLGKQTPVRVTSKQKANANSTFHQGTENITNKKSKWILAKPKSRKLSNSCMLKTIE